MKLIFKTLLPGSVDEIYNSFDRKLFEYLLPPGAELIRFDGSKPGDIVHLRLGFPIFGEWISAITEEEIHTDERFFVDEGRKLPFGMKSWRHTHIVRSKGSSVEIVDHIEYSMGSKLLDILVYPGLFAAFAPRKWQYKKYFQA